MNMSVSFGMQSFFTHPCTTRSDLGYRHFFQFNEACFGKFPLSAVIQRNSLKLFMVVILHFVMRMCSDKQHELSNHYCTLGGKTLNHAFV